MTIPVDPNSRLQLRNLVEELITKRMGTQQYDDAVWSIETKDRAVHAIRSRLWSMYTDAFDTRLDVGQLPPETVALFRRCIAFLETELQYRWSRTNFISAIGLLRFLPWVRRKLEREQKEGHWAVWPFFRHEDARRD